MSNCEFEFTGRKSGEKFVFRCKNCGKDASGKYQDHPPKRKCGKATDGIRLAPPPASGVGTELKSLLKKYGIKPHKSCGCEAMAARMDAWGVSGCQEQLAEILEQLKAGYDSSTLWERAKAGITSIIAGLPKSFLEIFNEAVLMAEAKGHIRPPLKVAFLSPGLTCGGAERWILSLSQNFDPAKVWVQAIGVDGPAKHIDPMMLAEVPKHIRVVSEWDNILPVAKAVDFLIIWGSPGMIDLAKASGKPFVVVVHGADETSSYGGRIARKGIEAGGMAACVNEACLACYPPEYRDRVSIIPNGADEERVKPIAGRDATRFELGIDYNQKVLLYLGRVMRDKYIDRVAAVVESLPPEWVCVLAGPIDAFGEKHIGGRMRHIPARNHVGDLLAAADVQILLSPTEAHPLSITEGWLAGVPTVVSPLPWIESIERQHGPMTWGKIHLDYRDVLEADAAGRGSEQVLFAQETARLEFTAKAMAARWTTLLLNRGS